MTFAMENFRDLFEQRKLDDIDTLLTEQFSSLPDGVYDAKLAVMLSMIVTKGMGRLDSIDTSAFPSDLDARFAEIKERYGKRLALFRQHLEENAAIIRAIEKAEADLPDLERRIAALLQEFDALVADRVRARDNTPVGAL